MCTKIERKLKLGRNQREERHYLRLVKLSLYNRITCVCVLRDHNTPYVCGLSILAEISLYIPELDS